VNLIMDKEVVKELIQDELTVENCRRELELLLNNETKQQQLATDYGALKKPVEPGRACFCQMQQKVFTSFLLHQRNSFTASIIIGHYKK